ARLPSDRVAPPGYRARPSPECAHKNVQCFEARVCGGGRNVGSFVSVFVGVVLLFRPDRRERRDNFIEQPPMSMQQLVDGFLEVAGYQVTQPFHFGLQALGLVKELEYVKNRELATVAESALE